MAAPWCATIVTLFPEFFPGPLQLAIPGRALKEEKWTFKTVNIRDHATDSYRTVDDTPYGGGVGMVMKPDVVHGALQKAHDYYKAPLPLIFFSPRGQPLTQSHVQRFSQSSEGIIMLCGRYEGIDQRVIDHWQKESHLEEISIGDYVLSGGEIPALVLLDACIRLLPGVLKKHEATDLESFSHGILEHSHYTKPAIWNGVSVPEVLLSGHHQNIQKWREENAKTITQTRRPDLSTETN